MVVFCVDANRFFLYVHFLHDSRSEQDPHEQLHQSLLPSIFPYPATYLFTTETTVTDQCVSHSKIYNLTISDFYVFHPQHEIPERNISLFPLDLLSLSDCLLPDRTEQ